MPEYNHEYKMCWNCGKEIFSKNKYCEYCKATQWGWRMYIFLVVMVVIIIILIYYKALI